MELQPTIERLNEAVRGARTAHGKPLDIVWIPAEGGYMMRVVTWSDDRKTIEDVAAMATAESRVAAIALGFVDELCTDRGLPALSPERALLLFYLDSPEALPDRDRDSHEARLAEATDAVGADAELDPHALAILERWAEHGFASYVAEDGEPLVPLIATRLYRLLVTRLTGPALARLDRLLHLEPSDVGWPTPYRLIDLDDRRSLPTAPWLPPVQS